MTQEFVTLPREVVKQALDTMTDTALGAKVFRPKVRSSLKALSAALEQPQRKLTSQDIADSALLSNIESPFNACMHQEHCKRWKAQAGADSSLRAAVQQACDWISEEPGRRPISAGRLLAILTNALAAAPQPPVVEQHADDAAVSRFAEAMKAKLAAARCKGRGGWDNPEQCTVENLAKMLVEHIAKGDPVDVANFAMMLHQRGADKGVLAAAAAPQPQGEQKPVAGVVIDGSWNLPSLVRIGSEDSHIKKFGGNRLYTNPQPKREPLTEMQKMMCWSRATHDADVWHKTEHQCLMDYGAEIEAAHNIK